MSREVCGICWCPYDEDTGECACEPEPKKQHMTTLRTAAQQALEALEEYQAKGAPFWACDGAVAALRAALAEPPINQCAETCERAKLCAVCARGLAEPEDWELRRLREELERCKQTCAATSEAWRKEAALAEPVQQGCDHCNHPLYAAIKCRVCGRVTEPVQEPPEFPPHDDKVHAGAVYWYVGTDGKYYSSNEVKLFMQAKNKSLHYEPPKWVLDNFDLIPLYTAPPQRKPLTEEEILSLFRTAGSPVEFARAIEAKHGIL